jgi:hypothetical protein
MNFFYQIGQALSRYGQLTIIQPSHGAVANTAVPSAITIDQLKRNIEALTSTQFANLVLPRIESMHFDYLPGNNSVRIQSVVTFPSPFD